MIFHQAGVWVAENAGDLSPTYWAPKLQAAHFSWVTIKVHDGTTRINHGAVSTWRGVMAPYGIQVGCWGVLQDDPSGEAALASSIINSEGAAFYIADQEGTYKGDPGTPIWFRSSQWCAAFRAAQPSLPLGWSGLPNEPMGEQYDWLSWNSIGAHWLPQCYPNQFPTEPAQWPGPPNVPGAIQIATRKFAIGAIHPTWGLYGGVGGDIHCAAYITSTQQAAALGYRATGYSLYLLQHVTDDDLAVCATVNTASAEPPPATPPPQPPPAPPPAPPTPPPGTLPPGTTPPPTQPPPYQPPGPTPPGPSGPPGPTGPSGSPTFVPIAGGQPNVCRGMIGRWSFGSPGDVYAFQLIDASIDPHDYYPLALLYDYQEHFPKHHGLYEMPPDFIQLYNIGAYQPVPWDGRVDDFGVGQVVIGSIYQPYPALPEYATDRNAHFPVGVPWPVRWYFENSWSFAIWVASFGTYAITSLPGNYSRVQGLVGNFSGCDGFCARGWGIYANFHDDQTLLNFQYGPYSMGMGAITQSTVEAPAWHLLTVTSNGTTIKTFIDAVQTGEAAYHDFNSGAQTLLFGSMDLRAIYSGAYWPWNGAWDEAMMWNFPLDPVDVIVIYEGCGGLKIKRKMGALGP